MLVFNSDGDYLLLFLSPKGVLNTHKSSIQVKTEVKMEPVAMETELDNDKNLCFLLFRKFIREVGVFNLLCSVHCRLLESCLSSWYGAGGGSDAAVQGRSSLLLSAAGTLNTQ